jgi:hypothetical protein
MREATDRRPIETTLWELANVIHEATSSEDEAVRGAGSDAHRGPDLRPLKRRICVLSMAPACAA